VSTDTLNAFDRRYLRRSFDRAGASYDAAAVLQTEVRGQLLERLQLLKISPKTVLDAGAGTGHASRALLERYPRALVLCTDLAVGMLQAAKQRLSWRRKFARICADSALLPFADSSVDLIFSNLMLQWCDPEAVFREFRRVLTPQGTLCFTSFGPDTLKELRVAWAAVDDFNHVSEFPDMHDLGDALVRAGFAQPVLDVDRYTLQYSDVKALARDLKAIGAHDASAGRRRGLTSPRKFAAMQAAYERYRQGERLPASYEVIFGQAWAGLPATRATDRTSISLDSLRQQLRARRRP
jgi:malonyl-CoA O-methyltransferase